ncbi:MAG: hypothetical protein HQL45_04495 [Alphaproteobacteria bacterium]|nr:hypothetical protein [Alphaproteobacteria bacterium]
MDDYSRDDLRFIPHAIRIMPRDGNTPPIISADTLTRLANAPPHPTPQEQADNLIRWIGETQTSPGDTLTASFEKIGAIIGITSPADFTFLQRSLLKLGLIEARGDDAPDQQIRLTFNGWARYEELKKGAVSGNTAFMAMKFEDPLLDRVLEASFRPAVKATGFELRKLDDPEISRAGLIDDRLRVEIKKARFIISDLTHENRGSYWEAGYAEGLGKPVIYTCQKSTFEERARNGGGTHFDTNHHLHILWDENNLPVAQSDLKACIRATLPEARQQDTI